MTRISDLITTSTISNTGVFVVVDQNVTKKLSWLDFKTSGLKGDTGNTGPQGPTGLTGATGTAATITVGTVTSGTTATVTNVGNANAAVFNFTLPAGPKGDTGTYVLTTASTATLGGVKIGSGISITGDGTISATTATQYVLVTATNSILGGVKIGSGISITGDGTISASTATQYQLTTATATVLGGVKIGAGVNITNGVISVTTGAFALQTATNAILGGVKIGARLTSSADGTVSANIASASTTGTVRIGTGIDVTANGLISVNSAYLSAAALTGTTLSSNVVASSLTSLGNLASLTVQGTASIQQTLESYTAINGATGTVTHDCSTGVVFVHTGAVANWTANFTNVPTTPNKTSSVALLITQQATPYIPQFLQINGVAQIIRWQGGVTPTGNVGKRDLVNFTFISQTSTSTTFTVLGSLSSFG